MQIAICTPGYQNFGTDPYSTWVFLLGGINGTIVGDGSFGEEIWLTIMAARANKFVKRNA
jgi:hypothetical protein